VEEDGVAQAMERMGLTEYSCLHENSRTA
jgi:hypothetical protein